MQGLMSSLCQSLFFIFQMETAILIRRWLLLIRNISFVMFIIFFSGTSHILAEVNSQIEIFEIEKGTVITVPSNDLFQLEAVNILKDIKDVYKKLNPIPNKGMMVKIPVNPMIPIQNQWMNSLIDEVIIFFPEDDEPYIMTYDDENNFYFFSINQSKLATEFVFKLLGF